MANIFSPSQIIDEVKEVKLLSHKGFSDSEPVAKKMDQVELREQYAWVKVKTLYQSQFF
ncbi:hypothetical protein [uncultured Nostoc sp.]|uniref:hypothetical protein n=1 Tax=uncultured Nostoc sp. TaxID=340711 RepID=UPI0035CC6A39